MSILYDVPLACDNERDLQDAWKMLQQLFALMDEDHSGGIDPYELLAALRKYASAKHSTLETRTCMKILQEVDGNQDRLLDLREFAMFISRYSNAVGVPILELVFFMVELMGKKKAGSFYGLNKWGIRLLHGLREEEVSRANFSTLSSRRATC
jgi:hypothetical protein